MCVLAISVSVVSICAVVCAHMLQDVNVAMDALVVWREIEWVGIEVCVFWLFLCLW